MSADTPLHDPLAFRGRVEMRAFESELLRDNRIGDPIGGSFAHLERVSINGMKRAFLHYDDRMNFIFDRIKPGFAAIRSELGLDV
jgi:hypothetical protein